jgi:hypothetical protein
MTLRHSPEMTLVAYFLSRCGERVPNKKALGPPTVLGAKNWERAYAMFFATLGDGRTLSVFRNGLKNARDDFDGHLPSGRAGWRAKGSQTATQRPPRPLTSQEQELMQIWSSRSDDDLWKSARRFADQTVGSVEHFILSDLAAELDPEKSGIIKKTEGGRKVIVSVRVERDPSLRAAAIRAHGTTCTVCGFSFRAMYGEWGEGFAVVHHLVPFGHGEASIGERDTNPATDLVVLCANCHCMVHRKKELVLTVNELKAKLLFDFCPLIETTPVQRVQLRDRSKLNR